MTANELGPSGAEKDVTRFWAKVEKMNSCWYWRSNLDRDGYGKFYVGRRT